MVYGEMNSLPSKKKSSLLTDGAPVPATVFLRQFYVAVRTPSPTRDSADATCLRHIFVYFFVFLINSPNR